MQNEAPATIGHNKSPFQITTETISDLFDEALNWNDGKPLETKKQHDTLVELIRQLRSAKTACDNSRKDEVVYWNDGKKEVQDRYNPFLKKAGTAIDVSQKTLEPYLLEQTRLKREKDKILAQEAFIAGVEADAAMQASSGDLEAREEAEHRLEDAKEIAKIAARAAKQNVAKGAQSRWDVVIVDRWTAATYLWAKTDLMVEFDEFLLELAKRQVKFGKREIPGFTITERIVV